MCSDFPKHSFVFVHSKSSSAPEALKHHSNLLCIDKFERIPGGPCVVVSTSAKCSWTDPKATAFDVLIVDEAFQLPDYRFHVIASLGKRIILIGDPGQIDPVVQSDTSRWKGCADGPHVPCPDALKARHPELSVVRLPVSRRLCADTVDFVQPAFYPQHPFVGLAARGSRKLLVDHTVLPNDHLGRMLALASEGKSLLQMELPKQHQQDVDLELVEQMIACLELLFEAKAELEKDGVRRPLIPSDIGIACAHVVQVSALQERLPGQLHDIYIETCDRFQGLERELMLVYHPLSGRMDVDTFHMDTGRMCVALSRHRTACFLFARQGIQELLQSSLASDERVIGVDTDPYCAGWRTQMTLLQRLDEAQRIIQADL
jgi:hypothetical protein